MNYSDEMICDNTGPIVVITNRIQLRISIHLLKALPQYTIPIATTHPTSYTGRCPVSPFAGLFSCQVQPWQCLVVCPTARQTLQQLRIATLLWDLWLSDRDCLNWQFCKLQIIWLRIHQYTLVQYYQFAYLTCILHVSSFWLLDHWDLQRWLGSKDRKKPQVLQSNSKTERRWLAWVSGHLKP